MRPHSPPTQCLVIGAGLAGAAVAASLARRGVAVQVLEAGAEPAIGASSLPVGMLTPHFSADDNLFSRLTRAGAQLTWQAAKLILREHLDWAVCGTLEVQIATPMRRSIKRPAALADASGEDMALWDRPASAEQLKACRLGTGTAARWHEKAGWIRPAALVRAFLARPGVHFVPGAMVAKLHRDGDSWQALGVQGETLATSHLVILAGGPQCDALLAGRLGLIPVGGMVSWGALEGIDAAALPPFPVNGHGSFIPHVPGESGPIWQLGASFHRDPKLPLDEALDHRANLARLASLLPGTAKALAARFASNQVMAWSGVRATTADHLPLAGPVDAQALPGLLVSTGMGSRGLSFSVLCAELIAAQLFAEDLPVEPKWAAALAAERGKRRRNAG